MGPGSAGEENGKGSGDCSKESAVLDLLTVHMQLVSMQQSHQAPGVLMRIPVKRCIHMSLMIWR